MKKQFLIFRKHGLTAQTKIMGSRILKKCFAWKCEISQNQKEKEKRRYHAFSAKKLCQNLFALTKKIMTFYGFNSKLQPNKEKEQLSWKYPTLQAK